MTLTATVRAVCLALALTAGTSAGTVRSAEPVTVAALTFVSSSPLFIAAERGYFADEGLDVTVSFFRAAQPVAVAIAAGDADFGVTAFTAGFFNLAAKGALKVIAAQLHEVEGFEGSAILASNQAHAAGLTTVEDLPGHSFAMTQVGSSFHYMIGRIAEQVGFDLAAVDLRPLQSVGNMIGALRSGQVDSMIIVPHIAKPLANAGAARIIGWVSDYAPYQVGGLFTSTTNVTQRRSVVEAFVRAYQKGIADYRAAFIDGDHDRAAVVALIHTYVYSDQDAAAAHPKIESGAMYIEADGRLDVADVHKQIGWYQDRGLVDAAADPTAIIDTSFVEPLTPPAN